MFPRYLLSSAFLCLFLSTGLLAQNPTTGFNFTCQDDGRISLAFSGDTTVATCTVDTIFDRLRFQVQPFRMAHAYVVVDDADIIQYINFSNFINFDVLPPGRLRVYAFSTVFRPTARVGDVFTGATLSTPCFGLTENFVEVFNGAPGTVELTAARDTFRTCPDDNLADTVRVGSPNAGAFYVITDENGTVLETTPDSNVVFHGMGTGTRRIYAAVGVTANPGDIIADLATGGGCGTGVSANFVTVLRMALNGGMVNTAGGSLNVTICPGDGVPDPITFTVSGASGDSSRYVVTDEANVVLDLPVDNVIDFENAPVGICRVWHLSFTGDFIGTPGMLVGSVPLATGCEAISGNFVQINRVVPTVDPVALIGGGDTLITCPQDGVADIVMVTSRARGGDLYYYVTNQDGLILRSQQGASFDVDNFPLGTCRVYAASIQGAARTPFLQNIATVDLSDGCFDLSDNFVTVIRTIPEGGTVSSINGATTLEFCPGDGFADLAEFTVSGNSGEAFTYVVTDENNVILDVPAGTVVDFEGAGIGVCRLWGVGYNGNFTGTAGDTLDVSSLADGCFGLSDNFVTVIRDLPDGGTVRLDNNQTSVELCSTDGISDILTFVSTGATGDTFALVITDTLGEILSFPQGNTVDFEGVPAGVCRVYGLAFAGTVTADEGDFLADGNLTSGCFALSDNFVTVTRIVATTGRITTEAGDTTLLVCPGNAIPDVVELDSTGTTLSRFVYLVTDENNVVITAPFGDRLNFDNFPLGVCRVYGLGYDGLFIPTPGLVVGQDQLASGCSAVSSNFITVNKQAPDGGVVSSMDGDTTLLCPMDGLADSVFVSTTSTSVGEYTYLVTDDMGTILQTQDAGAFDFETAPFGTCRIYGLAYQGTLLAVPGDNVNSGVLADDCSALSSNYVTVIREMARGGSVALLPDGGDRTVTCPGDGVADIVSFASSGASPLNFVYVITDANNVVLDTTTAGQADFEGAGTGECRVWGLSYAGSLSLMAGDTIVSADDLATGCAALSDNFITVIREVPDGGSISLADGTNVIDICSGDATADLLTFSTTSGSANYGYLITQMDFIIAFVPGTSFDFSNTISGTYEIYGLAWTGDLSLSPVEPVSTSQLATSCFELSDTTITLNVTEVEGGTIAGNGLDTIHLCASNPDDGFIQLTSTSRFDDTTYTYVVTTPTDNPVILNVLDSNSVDLGASPLQEVRIYAIDYTGDLTVGPGFPLLILPLSDGCYAVSDNFITVTNDDPVGGRLIASNVNADGLFCAVDGNNDLSVTTTSNSSTGYAYVVLDTAGVVVGVSQDTNVTIGSLPTGDYDLLGIAYTGTLSVNVGDTAANVIYADNCFELSDTLRVTNGGALTAGSITAAGFPSNEVEFCLNDPGTPVILVNSTVNGLGYRLVLTDDNGVIVTPNLPSDIVTFFGFATGEYRIYGVNVTGFPRIQRGRSIDGVLSTACYAVTDEFITVNIDNPDAGTVTTDLMETDTTVRIDANGSAPITFVNTSDSLNDYVYVVTDSNNVVLDVTDQATIDFGPAGPGVCLVWGLAFSGDVLVVPGDTLGSAALADDCHELSAGAVRVERLPAGMIGTGPGAPGTDAVSLLVSPNPAQGPTIQLLMTTTGTLPAGDVSVRDMMGQRYNLTAVAGGGTSAAVTLDVSGLPSGMYFARFVGGGAQYSVMFVVP